MFPKHCACHTPDFADRYQTQIHRDSRGAMGMYIKAWEDITAWVHSGDSPAAGRWEVMFSSFLRAFWCWSVRTAHFGIFPQLRFLWLCSLHKHLAFLHDQEEPCGTNAGDRHLCQLTTATHYYRAPKLDDFIIPKNMSALAICLVRLEPCHTRY